MNAGLQPSCLTQNPIDAFPDVISTALKLCGFCLRAVRFVPPVRCFIFDLFSSLFCSENCPLMVSNSALQALNCGQVVLGSTLRTLRLEDRRSTLLCRRSLCAVILVSAAFGCAPASAIHISNTAVAFTTKFFCCSERFLSSSTKSILALTAT